METRKEECGTISLIEEIHIDHLIAKLNGLKENGATHIILDEYGNELAGYFEREETNEERINREERQNTVIRIQYKKRMS